MEPTVILALMKAFEMVTKAIEVWTSIEREAKTRRKNRVINPSRKQV